MINDFQYESRLRKQGQRSFAKYRNMNRSYQRCQKFDSSLALCGDIRDVVSSPAKAKMKYHHLERCFTNRVKRPVVFRCLRAPNLLGLGLSGGNPTFTRGHCGLLLCPRLGQLRHREDPTVAKTAPSVFPSGELVASLVSRHLPDGEFGWGGISVTRQRRCPKAGSVGTELSRRTQA